MTKRTETIGIRVVPEVKTAIAMAAGDVNRSVASLVETILIEHLLTLGYLDADQLELSMGMSGRGAEAQDHGAHLRAVRNGAK